VDLININVNICDRPYRLKVKPEEEESVRKAARVINDKVKDLQSQYSAKDKQDYLSMASLMLMVEQLNKPSTLTIEDAGFSDRIEELENRLDQVLSS
jgi:cell division protein ZapA (FtsZ GTPase activity inhibitor)